MLLEITADLFGASNDCPGLFQPIICLGQEWDYGTGFADSLKVWKTQQWLYKTDICIFFCVKKGANPQEELLLVGDLIPV